MLEGGRLRLYTAERFAGVITRDAYGNNNNNKLCRRPPQYAPTPCKLTFDLLTLKVVSESRTTWTTSEPILVFLGLSVLGLGPMYATDRQTDRRQTASSLNAPA